MEEYLLSSNFPHKNDMFRHIKKKIIVEIRHDTFVQNIFHQNSFKNIKMWKSLAEW